jgi:hypothetical protein
MFIVIISKGFPVVGPAPHKLKFPQKVAPVAGPTIILLPAGRKFGRKTQMGTIQNESSPAFLHQISGLFTPKVTGIVVLSYNCIL